MPDTPKFTDTRSPCSSTLSLPRCGIVLAFDFGLKRIGVAYGETLLETAHALCTLPTQSQLLKNIKHLVDTWHPVFFVVGLPLNMDGSRHTLEGSCHNFAKKLQTEFGLPVVFHDERLSSQQAEEQLKTNARLSWQKRKSLVDAHAAQIILQSYFYGRT